MYFNQQPWNYIDPAFCIEHCVFCGHIKTGKPYRIYKPPAVRSCFRSERAIFDCARGDQNLKAGQGLFLVKPRYRADEEIGVPGIFKEFEIRISIGLELGPEGVCR